MKVTTRIAAALIGAEIAMAGLFGAFGVLHTSATAYAASPLEDQPGWSCVDDGNRICGPGNSEGKPAACYDDGGAIVALWPCHVVVNPDGSSDVYN